GYGTGLTEALTNKQASIEHAEQYVYHGFGDDLDPSAIPHWAQLTRDAGAAVTPTLSVITGLIAQWEARDSVLKQPEVRLLDPEVYAWWKTDPGHSAALNHVLLPFFYEIVRGLHDAHVPLLAGTDFYIWGNEPGISLHTEL